MKMQNHQKAVFIMPKAKPQVSHF